MSLIIPTLALKKFVEDTQQNFIANNQLPKLVQLNKFLEEVPKKSNYLIGDYIYFQKFEGNLLSFRDSSVKLRDHFKVEGLNPNCKIVLSLDQRKKLLTLL
jgi:hypothetical protein